MVSDIPFLQVNQFLLSQLIMQVLLGLLKPFFLVLKVGADQYSRGLQLFVTIGLRQIILDLLIECSVYSLFPAENAFTEENLCEVVLDVVEDGKRAFDDYLHRSVNPKRQHNESLVLQTEVYYNHE